MISETLGEIKTSILYYSASKAQEQQGQNRAFLCFIWFQIIQEKFKPEERKIPNAQE
ncbi:MAG: hypothetical protein HXX20_16640 [Chloroflexi bacterium]|nr:hypothetical protein [Chloroflexota bacterium]